MNILNYKQFRQFDNNTIKWLDNQITESEFLNGLTNLNESTFKSKITNILWTFITKSIEFGFSILEKLKKFCNWVINWITKIKEKNPLLFKVIMITLAVVIILIISCSVAHAGDIDSITQNRINVAIGMLEDIKNKSSNSNNIITNAIAHLIDIRDGQIDIKNINKESIELANRAIKTTGEMISQKDNATMSLCLELMEKGAKFVSAELVKTENGEITRILSK